MTDSSKSASGLREAPQVAVVETAPVSGARVNPASGRSTLPSSAEVSTAIDAPGVSARAGGPASADARVAVSPQKDAAPKDVVLVRDASASDKAAAEDWIGKVIASKYRVDEVIGRGGMGFVLRARHIALDEQVAIKLLRPSMLEVPGMVVRFMREARAASKIKGDHVVRVTDVDSLESGVPYMVMEYLEGTDLSAVLREKGPIPIDVAVRYVMETCDAIAEAHTLGIVHRDLKPANLFLARRRDGRTLIKVLDFGISKVEGPHEEQDTTKTGTMMGSPRFMSPEQMMSMRDVDGRADIWALGAILYDLLTGHPPFVAPSTPQVCALVLNADPEPPRVTRPEVPVELENAVLRCLRKNPAQRFATVAELSRALAPFDAEGRGPMSFSGVEGPRSLSSAETPVSHQTAMASAMDLALMPKRRPLGTIIGGVSLLLAIGIAAAILAERSDPTAASASPPPQDSSALGATAPPSAVAAASIAVSPTANASSAPIPSAAPVTSVRAAGAVGAKKYPPPGGKKTGPTSDPFGGSRN
jgi:eukaryotic-like serine/threonine-protein kinase